MFSHVIFSLFLAAQESADFTTVRAAVDQAAAENDPAAVLVVFDLDNTILAPETNLGSEHWFMWQADLLKAGKPAAAKTVDDLLTVQGWMTNAGATHAVEPRIPTDVQGFVARGIKVMSVTSRNLDVRDATLRELARNGLDLAATAPGPTGGYANRYLPEDPELTTPKEVIYERGVLLTQGQNKGLMLRALLARTGYQPAAIVFVDDRPHHLENVQKAFKDSPIGVTTIRYVHELPRVTAFNASDKAFESAQWCAFADGLARSVFAGATSLPFAPCAAP